MTLRYAPTGLTKIAAALERLDKTAASTRMLPLGRAAGYGALAGLGVHVGSHLAAPPSDLPPDPNDTATRAAAKSAAGGVAIAGLLNFLNKVTAKR